MSPSPAIAPSDQGERGPRAPSPDPPLISPVLFLAVASLPLGLGAYGGYRREVGRAAAEEGGGRGGGGGIVSRLRAGDPAAVPEVHRPSAPPGGPRGGPVVPPVAAARALVLGSMLSVSGVGLLSAAALYGFGCSSVDEAVRSLRRWAPRKRRELERFLGLPGTGEGVAGPDLAATGGMTEEEELDYLRRTYLADVYEDGGGDGKGGGGSARDG